jgi:hypothetical protein
LTQSRDLKNIAALFKLSETENETFFRAAGSLTPKIQNLPFPPNPFFTGRESELWLLSRLFEQNERIAITQPISVSGLGGIGKTQLALEYAHQSYPGVYHSVFFVYEIVECPTHTCTYFLKCKGVVPSIIQNVRLDSPYLILLFPSSRLQ